MSRPPAKNLGAGDAWGRWVETAISKLSGTTSQVSQQAVNASMSAQATTAAVGRTATDLTSLTTSVGNIQENVGATLDVALTAQEAADLVNSELILLSGKTGRVIYSEVEPTGDDANVNNLWIETTTGKLYSYVNGTWTLVTDERLIAAANTADAATNLANAAQEQADLAKGLAEAAQDSADTANTAAGAANTAALSAASDAANAQSTANTANTNALAAQSTADAAEENLLVLAGKTGRTIRQESAPTGADANANNLWIKTSTGQTYSYVGSTWTLITDTRITAAASAATAAQTTATNAATAAATAQTTANNAAAAALAAQNTADTANNKATTADGRYTVAASNPTVSDGSGKPTDAVWEVRSGATMLRRFIWTGTAWTQVKAGQDFIGDKAIGQAQIGDLAVGTAQMADASITNAKIGNLAVGTAQMMNASITGSLLADVIQLATRLVAGNPDGNRTEINASGVHVFRGGVERTRLSASGNGLQVWNSSMGAMVDLSAAAFGAQILTHNPKLIVPTPGSSSAWNEWKPGAWVFQSLGQWTATTDRAQIFSTTSLGDAGVGQSFGVRIAFTMTPVDGGTQISLTDTGDEYGAVVQRSSPNPNFSIVSCTPGVTYAVRLQAQAIRYQGTSGGTPWIKNSQIALTPI